MGFAKRHAEEVYARGFDDTEDAICLNCIIDVELRTEVENHLSEWRCTFCNLSAGEDDDPIAATFEDFMYIIMPAVAFLFTTADEAGLVYDEGEWIGGTIYDSSDVAYAVCEGDVSDEVLTAIGECITEQMWTESHISELRQDQSLRMGWEAFCDKVKYSSRFVFLSATEESSGHPDDFTTAELLKKLERIVLKYDVLQEIEIGREFWRGRLTDDPSNVRKWRNAADLGAPPRHIASNSRMSPAGISMFYGSDTAETVVAEIGAHGSQRYAIVGAFETTRKLTLLDLVNLPSIPSLYREEGRSQRYYDMKFLHLFARDLGKPITLDGQEHIEYVPTQVITEYLRYIPEYAVDGILYRSAQNNGVCCVLFCDSSGCVDTANPPPRPYGLTAEPVLQIRSESVKWVRILAQISDH